MVSMRFEFDERALRREVQRQAQGAVGDLARSMTREMDELRERYTGRPVAEIKPAITRLFQADGGSISDPELSEYAQMISDGARIEFRPDTIRW